MTHLKRQSTPPLPTVHTRCNSDSKPRVVHSPTPTMRRYLFVPVILLPLLWGSCGGSGPGTANRDEYAQAGVVAGIAVTAALIQTARGKAHPVKKTDQCCAICDKCSYPCGNVCLTIGNICYQPPGCACYDSQLPLDERPPERDLPCALPPGEDTPVVVPMGGVSF